VKARASQVTDEKTTTVEKKKERRMGDEGEKKEIQHPNPNQKSRIILSRSEPSKRQYKKKEKTDLKRGAITAKKTLFPKESHTKKEETGAKGKGSTSTVERHRLKASLKRGKKKGQNMEQHLSEPASPLPKPLLSQGNPGDTEEGCRDLKEHRTKGKE